MAPAAPEPAHAPAWTIVAAAMAALGLAIGIGRFAYTALLPAMQAEGLGDGRAGLIAGVNFLAYLIGSWAAGRTPVPWRVPVFRISVLVSVATTAAMAAGSVLAGWLVLRGLAGLASAGVMVLGAVLLLDRLGAQGRPDLGGLAFSGIGFGIALCGLVPALAGAGLDRAEGWAIAGALAAALAVPAWALARRVPVPAPTHRQTRAGHRDATLIRLTLAYGLEGFGYAVAATFLVAVIARGTGSVTLAGWAWVVAGVAAIPAGAFWQAVADRRGALTALALAHLVQAAGMVLPVLSTGPVAAMVAAVTLGGTFIAIVGMALTEARRRAGAAAIGTITVVFGIGQALGPLTAGWTAEARGGFDLPLLGAAGAVLLGAALLAPRRP